MTTTDQPNFINACVQCGQSWVYGHVCPNANRTATQPILPTTTDQRSEAQTPLADLLDDVPEDIVLGIQGDEPVFKSYTNIPIGKLAKQAAAELRRLHQSEREAWRYASELEQDRGRLADENERLKAQEVSLIGGDERRHIICLCPDCTARKIVAAPQPAAPTQVETQGWLPIETAPMEQDQDIPAIFKNQAS